MALAVGCGDFLNRFRLSLAALSISLTLGISSSCFVTDDRVENHLESRLLALVGRARLLE